MERRMWGKLGLVLMGGATLNKSLIQFSVYGWSCVPSLLLARDQAVEEVMKRMAASSKGPCAGTSSLTAPNLAAGRHRPTPLPETLRLSQASLGQPPVGSPLLFPGCNKTSNRTRLTPTARTLRWPISQKGLKEKLVPEEDTLLLYNHWHRAWGKPYPLPDELCRCVIISSGIKEEIKKPKHLSFSPPHEPQTSFSFWGTLDLLSTYPGSNSFSFHCWFSGLWNHCRWWLQPWN